MMKDACRTEAVILVAGLGSRLKPLTASAPKCLTQVNGVPILGNMLNILAEAGVSKVTLVVGYLGDMVRSFAGSVWQKMNLHYVENPIPERTNTAYSLLLALKKKDARSDAVLVLEGDVFFEKALMDTVMANPAANKTVLASYHPPMEGSFAALDDDGHVKDWWHKSQQFQGFFMDDKFKTVNVHCFSRSFLDSVLIPEIEDQIRLSKGRAPMEYVMKTVIEKGAAIAAVVADGLKWWEIDDATDLRRAEALFHQGQT